MLLEEKSVVETSAQLNLLKASPLPENIAVRFKNYSASWSKSEKGAPTLRDINLTITRGKLVVITGYAGSGKVAKSF